MKIEQIIDDNEFLDIDELDTCIDWLDHPDNNFAFIKGQYKIEIDNKVDELKKLLWYEKQNVKKLMKENVK